MPVCRPDRRRLLALLALGAVGSARGQPASKRLVVGVEATLQASGLAARLAEAIGRDTGVSIDWRPGPSGLLLPQLERGELDAALTHEPEVEAALLRQNLIHDRRAVVATDIVLVGPAPKRATRKQPASGDPAGVAGAADGAEALRRIAAAGERGEAVYVASGEPSGTRHVEQALWKAAGPLPVPGCAPPGPGQAPCWRWHASSRPMRWSSAVCGWRRAAARGWRCWWKATRGWPSATT